MHGHIYQTTKVVLTMRLGKESLRNRLTNCTARQFDRLALDIFELQSRQNPVYCEYLRLTNQQKIEPEKWEQIPCLPVSLFRTHTIKTGSWKADTIFESSGTTGSNTSRHSIRSLKGYQQHCRQTFEKLIGPLSQFNLFALLPNYLERNNSGLVAMVADFIAHAGGSSAFYLHDISGLRQNISSSNRPVLLWGVTFALLDLVSEDKVVLPKGSILLETGGMKGQGPELIREKLHEKLIERYPTTTGKLRIMSEYGMTEMNSQAYLLKDQRFTPAQTLRVRSRDLTDPFQLRGFGKSGALNIYDLANIDTCCFLQLDDLGRVFEDDTFTVEGRIDQSVVRGCNLMVSEL